MTNSQLKSRRKVQIKSMTVDQMDECTDIPEVVFKNGKISTIKNS